MFATAKGLAPTEGSSRAYESTFSTLYQEYYSRVFAFVYSRLNDVEPTKDLVADIFERAYFKGQNLREPEAFRAWLFVVARNCIAGHFRRHKRELDYRDQVKDSLRIVDDRSGPADDVIRQETVENLMRHLRGLSARDQELLSLRFDVGLSHPEIAQVLHISPINVRVTMFRALKRLRARMDSADSEAVRLAASAA